MSRRLDVELTSKRDDGTYTWRAAGAKQPKGELDGGLLPEGASIGDVVRAEAEFAVDGVFIVSVAPIKGKREKADMLEILGSGKDEGSVTTQLVGKRGRGRDRDRGDREGGRGRGRGRGDRDGRKGPRGEGRGDRDGRKGPRGEGRGDGRRGPRGEGRGDRKGGRDGGRSNRPRRERAPDRPKPKRLRPGRTHRDAALKEVAEIQVPLARVVLRDGVPGVRQLVEKQNQKAKAAGQPEIPPKMLEAVGEKLLPKLRTAEWRDNAEAALAGIAEVDIRDIRKVVVAADNGAKDEESRALADQLRAGLTARVDAEHGKWLSELNNLVQEGRTVRALRQSSRPPKAGAPLPGDLATKLTEAANASMTADTSSDRWATVLDAVAYSPVRTQVKPQGLPTTVTDELRKTVKKLNKRVPDIAALFAPAPAPKAAAPAQVPPAPAAAAAESPAQTESVPAPAAETDPETASEPPTAG